MTVFKQLIAAVVFVVLSASACAGKDESATAAEQIVDAVEVAESSDSVTEVVETADEAAELQIPKMTEVDEARARELINNAQAEAEMEKLHNDSEKVAPE